MKPSSKIKGLIREFEGFRANAYRDGSVYSIGYGNTKYANGSPVKSGDVITKAAAEILFSDVLNQFAKEVTKVVTANINQNQFDALVSFAYNVGIGALKASTLLKKVNSNPKDSTIRAEFNKYIYASGVKLNGLIKRRKAEADHYFSYSETVKPFFLIAVCMVSGFIYYKHFKS